MFIGIFDELDASLFQPLPIRENVIAGEPDHVPGRIVVATMHFAMSAQSQCGSIESILAENDKARRFVNNLESKHIPIKWQQVIQIFTPKRYTAKLLDHPVLLFKCLSISLANVSCIFCMTLNSFGSWSSLIVSS